MNDKLKGAITGLLLGATLTSGAVFAKTGTETLNVLYNNIKLYVNGQRIDPKDTLGNPVEPFIINGTTYLPVRAVGNALGMEVNWDGDTNSVYLGVTPGVSEEKYFTDVCPVYQYSAGHKEYSNPDNDQNAKSFSMGGKNYTRGIIYENVATYQNYSVWTVHALDCKYTTLTFSVGPVKDRCVADASLRIYCDGVLCKEVELKPDMIIQDVTIDVEGVTQIKFSVDFDSSKHEKIGYGGNCRYYAIANPILK